MFRYCFRHKLSLLAKVASVVVFISLSFTAWGEEGDKPKLLTPNQFATIVSGMADNVMQVKLENKYRRYYQDYVGYFISFQQRVLSNINLEHCKLFAPFVREDLAPIFALFPYCRLYIMTGDIPVRLYHAVDVSVLPLELIWQYVLESMSLHPAAAELQKPDWEDFTSLVIGQLKVLGNEVLSVTPIYLYATGDLGFDPRPDSTQGVEIVFRLNKTRPVQSLLYWPSIGATDVTKLTALISRQEDLATLIRATEFSLYKPEFHGLAQVIADRSKLILQDESGVPFKYFTLDDWYIKHFGRYLQPGPYDPYEKYFQRELFTSYNLRGAEPLGFNLSPKPNYTSLTVMLRKHP